MSLPPLSPSGPQPARLRRRDVLLSACALIALAAVPAFCAPALPPDSRLDDFLLVSRTVAGAPLDRHAAVSRLRTLLDTDGRFSDHIETLAWLVRHHPGLDAPGLIDQLNTEASAELRAALARLVSAWSDLPDVAPALADARARIERDAAADLPPS